MIMNQWFPWYPAYNRKLSRRDLTILNPEIILQSFFRRYSRIHRCAGLTNWIRDPFMIPIQFITILYDRGYSIIKPRLQPIYQKGSFIYNLRYYYYNSWISLWINFARYQGAYPNRKSANRKCAVIPKGNPKIMWIHRKGIWVDMRSYLFAVHVLLLV